MNSNLTIAALVGVLVGEVIGVMYGAMFANTRAEFAAEAAGAGRYVVDPVTGERRFEWVGCGEGEPQP